MCRCGDSSVHTPCEAYTLRGPRVTTKAHTACVLTQPCLTLRPHAPEPPGSSVWGILQQEYWSGLPFASPGEPPHPGVGPTSPVSPASAGGFFTTSTTANTPCLKPHQCPSWHPGPFQSLLGYTPTPERGAHLSFSKTDQRDYRLSLVISFCISMEDARDFHSTEVECRHCVCSELLQSYPTTCDPMDCSPLDSSVHGILQARTLEWVVISSSRECTL